MAVRRAGATARREGGEEAARGDAEARFVRLAAELGDCMAFEPKQWREVFERSSQVLGRERGLSKEARMPGVGAVRGGDVKTSGQRRHTQKIARHVQVQGESERRPRSRNEGDEEPVRLPPVLVEEYLNQPAMIGELLQELSEGAGDSLSDTSEGNQDISKRPDQGFKELGAITRRPEDFILGNIDDSTGAGEPTELAGGGNALSTDSLPVILPVLSTISPSMKRGMSCLPSPTREELQQIQQLEQLADQEHNFDGLYRTLKRQYRQEKRESTAPRATHLPRRKAMANPGSLTALAVSTSVTKRRQSAERSILFRTDTGKAEKAPKQRHQLQPGQKRLSSHNPSSIERTQMTAEDRNTFGAAERTLDSSRPTNADTDTYVPNADITSIQCNLSPFEPSSYNALKNQQRQAIMNEHKVDEQVKHTIAEIRRWLPLDVIYEFGLGKFASPAQQRATELICRVGIRLQYGLLAHAMNQWKWWLDQTVRTEQIKSTLRLQCWWRRVCAVEELVRRRRIRLELQRRQLALLRHLTSKQQQAALQITRFFRRCVHVRSLQRHERELKAAVAIQAFWRKSCESWLALRRHMKKQQQIQAAVCVQRYARGMFARRRRRLLAKISRVAQRHYASNEAKARRAQDTKRLGAAITIQQGFREWNRRRIAALQRRRAAFEKDKRAIVKVQSYYRGKKARRFAQKYRSAVASAVLVLQCWWRCICARNAFKERKKALRSYRQQIRDQIRDAKRSAFPNMLAIKQKWTRLAATGEPTVITKDGKQYNASETRAAARIQGFWRGRMTRQRLKHQKAREAELIRRAKQRQLHAAAVCIQKRVRGIQGRARAWRRLENVSARRIQSFWRGVQTRWRLLQTRNAVRAVAKMQARWRSRRNKEKQRMRARAVTKIQVLARKFLGKRWLCAMVRRRQFLAEEQEMGRRLMEATKSRIKDELLLQSFAYKKLVVADAKASRDAGDGDDYRDDRIDTRVDRPLYHVDLAKRAWKRRGHDGVWQEVFRNASGNNLEIDNSHFARFLKVLPHSFIHKTQFPAQKADLCFAKMKEPKTKAISFSRFNKAILMVLREKFATLATDADTKRQEKAGKETRTGTDGGISSSSPVAGEQANTTEVDHANFLRFMKRYVLPSTIQDGKYRKMLEESCTQRLLWAVEVLRRFAAHIESRKKHGHFMVVYRERQVIKVENQRAAMIQKCYLKHKFRRELKAMLGAMFIEFIDYQGRTVKFTHVATGKTVSKRPVFLKGVLCGKTIPLPFPGEEFRAFCERHEDSTRLDKAPAEVYCVECEDVMCRICFARDHSKRHALQQHHVHPIQLCTHCGVETATRECLQCGNGKVPYCDCCFPLVHDQLRKGQSEQKPNAVETNVSDSTDTTARHRYRTLVVMCVECSMRVAQWKCDVCLDVYCKRCLISFHAKGMRQYHQFHRLSYFSVLREQAEEKRADDAEKLREKKRKQMEEDARRREAELAKQNKSATMIQSVVRSYLTRKQGKAYMKLVRQTQVARAQRQKDNVVRATVLYKVRSAFGLEPTLKSDTALEIAARQQRLTAIKRALLLEQFLLVNRSDRMGTNPQRRRRWTKRQRARAEHAARTWCAYDGRVRICKGEWRNHVATIVSTQNLMLSGHVLVFVELSKRSVVVNWEWLEPYDDNEILRQPYEPSHKALVDLSCDFQAKLSRAVERTARLARLLYLQTIEFHDIVQYAWVVEFNKHEQRLEYWNVVLNKKTVNVPKAMQLIEHMEPEEREKLNARVALAKSKLEALLHPFQPRNKPKVAQRRNAVVRVVLRGAKDAEQDSNEGARAKMEALRESMLAIDSARFWYESVEMNPKLSANRSAAVKFAVACAQPPKSSRMCWSLVNTLQWMDLHADDGFEATAKTLFALSTELQLFVVGELARSLDKNGEDFKDALPAFQQLLRLKEETLHLLLSKHEEAADAEREAAASLS